MDRYEREQFQRRLVRRMKRRREEEIRKAIGDPLKNRSKRWVIYVLQSIEGNLYHALENFTTTVAENSLRICYGIGMFALFLYVALSLLHNVKRDAVDVQQQAQP